MGNSNDHIVKELKWSCEHWLFVLFLGEWRAWPPNWFNQALPVWHKRTFTDHGELRSIYGCAIIFGSFCSRDGQKEYDIQLDVGPVSQEGNTYLITYLEFFAGFFKIVFQPMSSKSLFEWSFRSCRIRSCFFGSLPLLQRHFGHYSDWCGHKWLCRSGDVVLKNFMKSCG